MKYYYLFFLLCLGNLIHAQESEENNAKSSSTYFDVSMRIETRVLDAVTKEPVVYATVYNLSNGTGTVTNDSGNFVVSGVKLTDTIVVSFVGYEKAYIHPLDYGGGVIYLKPKTELLNAFTVTADNTFLYHLISRSSKNANTKTRNAKTYFSLKSAINNKQTELVEGYYNGKYSNYGIQNMDLKQGRIAMDPFNNRFFMSTETSKALYRHSLYEKSKAFPTSPFELSRGKLEKSYELSLSSKYKDDDDKIVYLIHFEPKDGVTNSFEGDVWIDSIDARVIKVNLEIKDAGEHPFLPIANIDSINQVDMYISKTYRMEEGQSFIQNIDFNYQVKYISSLKYNLEVSTTALLYAYDYQETFTLPYFEFSPGMYQDYHQISATPYNEYFWKQINEFGLYELRQANNNFVEKHASLAEHGALFETPIYQNGFFQFPYLGWSKKRIEFKPNDHEPPVENAKAGVPSEMYNLHAQIYCDINKFGDSLDVVTLSIFDPYKSFYYLEKDVYAALFINVYFDIVEIHRRQFVKDIQGLQTEAEVRQKYDEMMIRLEEETKRYFRDVNHGTNINAMKVWNDYVKKELWIDNLALFRIE